MLHRVDPEGRRDGLRRVGKHFRAAVQQHAARAHAADAVAPVRARRAEQMD